MSEEQTHIAEEKEPSSFRLIATLSIAGFLSGLILVSVYLFTAPFIANNKAEALKRAVFDVLPGTDRFDAYYWNGQALQLFEEGSDETDLIYFGYDSTGQFTGVAVPGEATGYQDVISALAGYNPAKEVIIGMKVLDSKETPGLGDKIILDNDFKKNFEHLAVIPDIEVVKKGEKTGGYQIEAITGATISSNAIGKLLKESITIWKGRIEDHLEKEG